MTCIIFRSEERTIKPEDKNSNLFQKGSSQNLQTRRLRCRPKNELKPIPKRQYRTRVLKGRQFRTVCPFTDLNRCCKSVCALNESPQLGDDSGAWYDHRPPRDAKAQEP